MHTTRRIVRNTSLLILSQGAYFVSGIVVMTFAARILGVADFGGFMFATSLVAFIEIFTNLGINLYSVKEISKNRSKVSTYWSNVLLIKIGLALFSIIAIIGISYYYNFEPLYIIIILAVSQFFNSIVIFNNAVFQAFEKMQFQLYVTIVEKVLLTVFTIMFLLAGLGIYGLAWLFFFTRIISLIFSLIQYNTNISPIRLIVDKSFLRETVLNTIPYAIFMVMGTIYFQLDSILLSYFCGNTEVGYYQAALRLVVVILLIPDIITKSLLPVMSQYFKSSTDKLHQLFDISLKYMTIIAIPLSVSVYLLAEPIILFLFGAEYLKSIIVLEVLSWVILLRFIGYILGVYFTVINKQIIRTYIVTIAAIISVILNIILIPRYGFWGASLTNLISNIFVFISYLLIIQMKIKKINLVDTFLKPVIAIFTGIVVIRLVNNIINPLLIPALITTIYIAILIFNKSLNTRELAQLIGNFRQH